MKETNKSSTNNTNNEPHKDSLPSGQHARQRKDEVNLAATGLAHQLPKEGQNKKDSKGLNRQHDGMTTSVEIPSTTEPVVTCSAKSQVEFKRAVNKLSIQYKSSMYHPSVPKLDRLYDGGDWSESSEDNDDLVWRAMWSQLPPWIRNPKIWDEEPETVWNPHQNPVVDLRSSRRP